MSVKPPFFHHEPGTYYLHEDNNLLLTTRDKDVIYTQWKEQHAIRPNKYHQVSYEPDIPIPNMPKRWDCSQLKPGDDLFGEPCCREPELVCHSFSNGWFCKTCGKQWVGLRSWRGKK